MSIQLHPLWTSEDERGSQTEENAHCPPPEKLSSLAFRLSMNSLSLAGRPSRVQRDAAMPSRALTQCTCAGDGDTGRCGIGSFTHRGHFILYTQRHTTNGLRQKKTTTIKWNYLVYQFKWMCDPNTHFHFLFSLHTCHEIRLHSLCCPTKRALQCVNLPHFQYLSTRDSALTTEKTFFDHRKGSPPRMIFPPLSLCVYDNIGGHMFQGCVGGEGFPLLSAACVCVESFTQALEDKWIPQTSRVICSGGATHPIIERASVTLKRTWRTPSVPFPRHRGEGRYYWRRKALGYGPVSIRDLQRLALSEWKHTVQWWNSGLLLEKYNTEVIHDQRQYMRQGCLKSSVESNDWDLIYIGCSLSEWLCDYYLIKYKSCLAYDMLSFTAQKVNVKIIVFQM